MHISKNRNTNKHCFFSGVLYSLGACFLWGLVFVVPQFLSQYKDIEIVLGRYLIFGLASLIGALISNRNFFKMYSFKIWRTGFIWGVLTNPVYYLGIVIGLRYAGPAITVVMTGLTPLTVLFYSNLKSKEVPQVTVAIISVVVIGGVLLTNLSILEQPIISTSFWKSIVGTATGILST
ncbi:MAG: DMT family transporter, partial [Victivallaceae bacterium]